MLADLYIALRAIISQRLIRTADGKRIPAVEILLNTKHIQDLVKDGEIGQIKEALERSLAPGSQSFEQALFNHYMSGRISIDEAMANSDSPTNLHWLIDNAPKGAAGATPAATTATKPPAPDDISSIKLNLDALG